MSEVRYAPQEQSPEIKYPPEVEQVFDEYQQAYNIRQSYLSERMQIVNRLYPDKNQPLTAEIKAEIDAQVRQSESYNKWIEFSGKQIQDVMDQNKKVGYTWHKKTQPIATDEEQKTLVEHGQLKHIDNGSAYKVVATLNPESRNLTPEAALLLDHIATVWQQRVIEKYQQSEKYGPKDLKINAQLIVTSLTRSAEYQNKLNQDSKQGNTGIPATTAEESIHTRGQAFDFGPEGFLKYNSGELLKELIVLLREYEVKGYIQPIFETGILAVHITRNPKYILENNHFVEK